MPGSDMLINVNYLIKGEVNKKCQYINPVMHNVV